MGTPSASTSFQCKCIRIQLIHQSKNKMIYDSNLQVQKLHVWNTWNTCRYRRYLNFSQDIKKSKHIKWTYHLLDAYISSTHSNPIQKAKIFQIFYIINPQPESVCPHGYLRNPLTYDRILLHA